MNAERIGSVFWFLFGAAAFMGARELGLGTAQEPGPGFLAAIAGAFVALMALIVFIQSLRSDPASRVRLADLFAEVNWHRALLICVITLAFILVFEKLGFFLSSLILLIVVMRGVEGLAWRTAVLIPLAAVISTWLLFHKVLGIALPAGILGS